MSEFAFEEEIIAPTAQDIRRARGALRLPPRREYVSVVTPPRVHSCGRRLTVDEETGRDVCWPCVIGELADA